MLKFSRVRFLSCCLVVLSHFLLFIVISRVHGLPSPKASNSMMMLHQLSSFRSNLSRNDVTKVVNKEAEKLKSNQVFPRNRNGRGEANLLNSNRLIIESSNRNEASEQEKFVEDLGIASAMNSKSHANKDLDALGGITARYRLAPPKNENDEVLTPAQQAAQDVRSNSAKLSKSEKFSVAMGTLDCIFQGRLPDGKIIREPGRWVIVPARSDGTLKPLAKARFCVRLHQAEDENTNDLTAISAGIKGKL